MSDPYGVDEPVAERMNAMPTVVFSRTLDKAAWQNTKRLKGNLAVEIRRMKSEPGESMAMLGCGSIVAQLAQERLIDEFRVSANPVAHPAGKTMLHGINATVPLKYTKTRTFHNGNVLLCYEPIG